MVIVTQNQYLQASKIYHVIMDEQVNYIEFRKNGKYASAREKYFQITIVYAPESYSTSGSGFSGGHQSSETRECCVNIRGAVNAHKVFNNLVEQIREQMPDTLFLREAVEKLLNGTNLEEISLKDKDFGDLEQLDKEHKSVRKPNKRATKLHKSGKAKRGSKAVLRRAK